MLNFLEPTANEFFSPFQIRGFAVSEDERQVVFCSSLNGTYHLWGFDPNSPFPYQLTTENRRSDAMVIHQGLGGSDSFILYTGDCDGDENMQIYAIPTYGGPPIPIRTAEGKRHFFAYLSPDGKRLYYSSNNGRPIYLNTYRFNLESGEEEILFEGSGAATYLSAVNLSETVFAYTKMYGRTNIPAYIQLQDEVIPLIPDENAKYITYQMLFRNDDTLYIVTNYDSEFSYLASFSIPTREFKKLAAINGEELRLAAPDRSSNLLYLVSSRGVKDFLYTFNPETHELKQQTAPVDNIVQVSVTKTGIVYLLGLSATLPPNIFRRTSSADWKMLTQNRPNGIDERKLASPQIVHYPSFDGTVIEGVYYPANPTCKNGHTIIWPHGGTQHNEQLYFNAMFHFFCHLGYNVFMPNFRGSQFYGDTFYRLVEQDWGGGAREDIVAGAKWMIAQGLAESGKLFVVGGSFGGYMTLLLLGRNGDMFKAGVDLFGPCNLLTIIESVPDYWKPRMEAWVGHPERDREKLIEQSPITYADKFDKPLLIYHGANDARVAKNESDQIVEALRKNGVDVKYVVFDDEGHSAFTKEHELQMCEEIAEFLAKLL